MLLLYFVLRIMLFKVRTPNGVEPLWAPCCKAATLGGIVELAIGEKLIGIEVEVNGRVKIQQNRVLF